MKNTYIIENSFTGYRAEIAPKGALPSVATLRKHFRAAKASDCKSSTICRDAQTGERVDIIDRGHGPEVLRID